MSANRPESLRVRVHRQLDPQAREADGLSLANRLVVLLIILSSLMAVLATEPVVMAELGWLLNDAEYVFAAIFTVEYGLRLWIAPVSGRHGKGWRAVPRYMVTPAALLDLVAILPVILMLTGGSIFLLRFARVMRLIRLARLGRFSRALDNMVVAVRSRAHELVLSLLAAFVLLLISSTVVYLCEATHQPAAFGSIPRAMWWSLATLTTVGYGDVVPVTPLGRIFATLTALTGVGLIAMPAGILASAFSEAMRNERRRER